MPRTLIVMLFSDHPEDPNVLLPSFQEIYGAINVERQQAIGVRPNGMWTNALVCDESDNVPYVHTNHEMLALYTDKICLCCAHDRYEYLAKKVHRLQEGMEDHPVFQMEERYFKTPAPMELVSKLWSVDESEVHLIERVSEQEVVM